MSQLELLYLFKWWLSFLIIGIVGFPFSFLFFKKFTDLGYAFSKILCPVIFTYIVFFLSICKLLPHHFPFLIIPILLFLAFNGWLFFIQKKEIIKGIRKKIKIIVFQEIFFTWGLTFWTYVRGFQPDINGLEKFMDYGFINSILTSKFLPPSDMWFAGNTINYYWFGHFWAAIMTTISRVPQWISYNLLLATIMGLSLTSIFSLISTLTKKIRPKINSKLVLLAGIISAIILVFGGNFHAPFYALKNGRENYWYPDATRFIGYNPETNDKTIHEFPIYSFVVSDLHAHLLNLPNVLLFLGLLWILLSKKDPMIKNYIITGVTLGVMFMTSAWDFANYSLVAGICFATFYLVKKGFKLRSFLEIILNITSIIVIALITIFPFLLSFKSIAQGIALVKSHTPVWQLSILWGYPAILVIIFIFLIIENLKNLKKSDLFIIGLLISSWLLIILPEIVFVKDIYISSHHRANTMFKLTYQAFVMSYLTSGYIFVKTLTSVKNLINKIAIFGLFALIFASLLWYPFFAVPSYYQKLKNYKGLSGETWLKNSYPYTFEVVDWFRKNVSGQPIILEAPGDSYTDSNVISAYTGFPTVSGWFVHEWLWRGSSEIPQARVSDIDIIYNSENLSQVKALLQKYKVSYVIVGEFEYEKYKNIRKEKFEKLGIEVFRNFRSSIYKINS
ncbi:hypothetical protein A2159_00070 [Candidatus Woesebacteria bacterium RBG_13_34_9]|uniref:YYY membrane protein n=1 Tax=Candidatus Woesebacteria bacterium RBG_13_34_9 TaxID=1802477 RepID=A0A1F7X5H9_9BACT|nr:MAG: hypothetical protein A2159_00070 [Candidatus Woesebacteria bacterium RBG_13_34_9]